MDSGSWHVSINENIKTILGGLPDNVELVAAAKTRSPNEVEEAINCGVRIIGENYVKEAEEAFAFIGDKVKWHFIGHLQKNKVKKAVQLFDMIETVDSAGLAEDISKRCGQLGKEMAVLVEVNSGKEEQKFGVFPEDVPELIRGISCFSGIKVMGLMTMGPFSEDPEISRPYFKVTRQVFEEVSDLDIPGVEMKYLSMGMTSSYKVAIEEGANLVRIGTKIFGERDYGER